MRLAQLAADLLGSEGLTKTASTFSDRDVLQALCERLGPSVSTDEIRRAAQKLLGSDRLVALYAVDAGLSSRDVLRLADGSVVPSTINFSVYMTGTTGKNHGSAKWPSSR